MPDSSQTQPGDQIAIDVDPAPTPSDPADQGPETVCGCIPFRLVIFVVLILLSAFTLVSLGFIRDYWWITPWATSYPWLSGLFLGASLIVYLVLVGAAHKGNVLVYRRASLANMGLFVATTVMHIVLVVLKRTIVLFAHTVVFVVMYACLGWSSWLLYKYAGVLAAAEVDAAKQGKDGRSV